MEDPNVPGEFNLRHLVCYMNGQRQISSRAYTAVAALYRAIVDNTLYTGLPPLSLPLTYTHMKIWICADDAWQKFHKSDRRLFIVKAIIMHRPPVARSSLNMTFVIVKDGSVVDTPYNHLYHRVVVLRCGWPPDTTGTGPLHHPRGRKSSENASGRGRGRSNFKVKWTVYVQYIQWTSRGKGQFMSVAVIYNFEPYNTAQVRQEQKTFRNFSQTYAKVPSIIMAFCLVYLSTSRKPINFFSECLHTSLNCSLSTCLPVCLS